MHHFFCRLNPPRPTFATDMTAEEQELMGEHAAYWSGLMEQGHVVAFGVVGDPAGPWGALVARADDEGSVRGWTDADPVIRRGTGFAYDVFPMPNAVTAA